MNQLFGESLPKLLAFIRIHASDQLLAQESVQDLAQSVFLGVLQDAANLEYRGEEAFRKLLFLRAVRKILDRDRFRLSARRDARREVRLQPKITPDDDAENVPRCYADFATPSRVACAREQLARFENAMRQLPNEQREAIARNRLMQMSYADAAKEMGRTESAVRGLVARGLARVSSVLHEASP